MTQQTEFALFDTRFGPAGLSWTAIGVSGARIPGEDNDSMRAAYLQSGAAENHQPPASVAEAISLLNRYFDGEEVDLTGIRLDMSFASAAMLPIYEHARTLRWGEMTTYGDIAKATGQPGAAQLVGQAMGTNRIPIIIPCHRVVAASGKLGGFSAPGGVKTKAKLLQMENARLRSADTSQIDLF